MTQNDNTMNEKCINHFSEMSLHLIYFLVLHASYVTPYK